MHGKRRALWQLVMGKTLEMWKLCAGKRPEWKGNSEADFVALFRNKFQQIGLSERLLSRML